jgi:hypothetical protein
MQTSKRATNFYTGSMMIYDYVSPLFNLIKVNNMTVLLETSISDNFHGGEGVTCVFLGSCAVWCGGGYQRYGGP